MRILVTGGAGFIGSHLVDKLIEKKHKVSVIDDLSTGYKKFVNPQAKFYKVKVESLKVKKIFTVEKPEAVYHLAAQKSVNFSLKNPLADAQSNIIGSLNIFECCRLFKVKKIIFISTGGAIYGEAKVIPTAEKEQEQPTSPYAISKLTADIYLKNFYQLLYKLPFISLRLSNVYGPRQDPYGEAGVIAIFVNRLLKKQICYINGSGNQTRDFIYVDDVVEACLKSLNKGYGIYNIGSAKETSVNKLYSLIAGQILQKKPLYKPAIKGEIYRSALKPLKAKKGLNWQAKTNLTEGIKKTINYFQKDNV
ncbi:NAD-dependent epimerase/dehydratase family protein [Patescibacteria group bacterium]|nr:NAD-dependent epimerase/dehydratase family protein [Patescibacteria group bacterium]